MLQNKCKIIFEVEGVNDAKLALQTMEVGSDGVLVSDSHNIKKIKEFIDDFTTEKLNLMPAKITKIEPVGMGDRVCVDTCSMFSVGEGMLVGSQSNGMFLVHSETIETPYVATRPFRVNAGAVHAYVRVPDGKTKYLSEIKAGDTVLAVDFKGKTRKVIVGRSKIEKRPLMLIKAEAQGKKFSTLLQNAETIRLADKNGKAVSVVDLKVGSEILAYVEEKVCTGSCSPTTKLFYGNPADIKKAGKSLILPSDFEANKLTYMEEIVYCKFSQNPSLMLQLFDTGNAILEEGNYWHDYFWGICPENSGQGQNHLGKILMRVRDRLRAEFNYDVGGDV